MPTNVTIPNLGDSVSEAVLIKWHKEDGEYVNADEAVCELETDKANVDVPSPVAGIIKRTKDSGETVHIGEAIAVVTEGAAPAAAKPSPKRTPPAPAATPEKPVVVVKQEDRGQQELSPAVRRMVTEEKVDPSKVTATGPGGRITKEDVAVHLQAQSKPAPVAVMMPPPPVAVKPSIPAPAASSPRVEVKAPANAQATRREPMSKIRKKIAERLVSAQSTAAILTTFNEVDLQAVNDLRAKYKEKFEKIHGIGLGYMSFFGRAACLALKDFPRVNAMIDGDDIVYHDYVNLGIAVSTERGLTVPVLRNAEQMSFANIEQEIKRLATASRDGKLGPEEMSGGTFTITNGGVFGSLLSTPIINMPQAAILGMHTIQKRPVVVNDQIVIRPMMYIALSYDHRLVDGKESVSFLVRIKEYLEDPARMVLGM